MRFSTVLHSLVFLCCFGTLNTVPDTSWTLPWENGVTPKLSIDLHSEIKGVPASLSNVIKMATQFVNLNNLFTQAGDLSLHIDTNGTFPITDYDLTEEEKEIYKKINEDHQKMMKVAQDSVRDRMILIARQNESRLEDVKFEAGKRLQELTQDTKNISQLEQKKQKLFKELSRKHQKMWLLSELQKKSLEQEVELRQLIGTNVALRKQISLLVQIRTRLAAEESVNLSHDLFPWHINALRERGNELDFKVFQGHLRQNHEQVRLNKKDFIPAEMKKYQEIVDENDSWKKDIEKHAGRPPPQPLVALSRIEERKEKSLKAAQEITDFRKKEQEVERIEREAAQERKRTNLIHHLDTMIYSLDLDAKKQDVDIASYQKQMDLLKDIIARLSQPQEEVASDEDIQMFVNMETLLSTTKADKVPKDNPTTVTEGSVTVATQKSVKTLEANKQKATLTPSDTIATPVPVNKSKTPEIQRSRTVKPNNTEFSLLPFYKILQKMFLRSRPEPLRSQNKLIISLSVVDVPNDPNMTQVFFNLTGSLDNGTESSDAVTEASDIVTESADIVTEASEAVTESADAVTESPDAVTESTDAVTESADAVTESSDAVTESTDAVTESADAVTEASDVVTEASDAVTESADAVTEAAAAEAESPNPPENVENPALRSHRTNNTSEASANVTEIPKITSQSPLNSSVTLPKPPLHSQMETTSHNVTENGLLHPQISQLQNISQNVSENGKNISQILNDTSQHPTNYSMIHSLQNTSQTAHNITQDAVINNATKT